MDRALYDAVVRNDTATLSHLLEEDPTLLDRTSFNEDKNALHIAAMMGHEAFVQAILQADSSSSYHMCLARNRDGRNPVHVAAMCGKLNILKLLIDHHDGRLIEAALEKADGGGTILHLCVKHNQLEAMKLLLKIFRDPGFVCAKNEDGMTILHLAIYYNQNTGRRREMVTFLIKKARIAKLLNIKNGDEKTALDLFLGQAGIRIDAFRRSKNSKKKLDLLLESGRVDGEILSSFVWAGALTGNEVLTFQEWNANQQKWLEKREAGIMVVLALIANMAFQAMVSPPGGFWQDDLEGPNPHTAGEAILAYKSPKHYRHLIIANTVAFVSSMSSIILLVPGTTRRVWIFNCFVMATWVSLAAIVITYAISFATVVPTSSRGQLTRVSEIVIIVIAAWGFQLVLIAGNLFLCLRDYCHTRFSVQDRGIPKTNFTIHINSNK